MVRKTLDMFEWVAGRIGWRRVPGVFVTRYEDLVENTASVLTDIGTYLGVEFEAGRVSKVIEEFSFERQWGRKPGTEDIHQHGRKGIIGDHVNFLTGERLRLWKERFPGIAQDWGYYETGREPVPKTEVFRPKELNRFLALPHRQRRSSENHYGSPWF